MSAGGITGSFTATGVSTSVHSNVPGPGYERSYAVQLSGDGVGTVQIECSLDDEVTWSPIYAAGTQLYVWTVSSPNLVEEGAMGVAKAKYRLRCTAYTSGTITYTLK